MSIRRLLVLVGIILPVSAVVWIFIKEGIQAGIW